MSTAVMTPRLELNSVANAALKASVRFWFVVLLLGQLLFAFTVASFYGMTAARGNIHTWTKILSHGIISGDGMGNFALATHLISAVIIILAGTLQLIPQIRNRFPVFHRWTGRLYIVTAFTVSLAGLYLMWARGTVGDLPQHLGTSLMAILIMIFAVMALRYAVARDFKTHRRWALRLYLVVSASLFIRAGIFLSLLLNRGPFGFDPATFSGPFLTFVSFAQYLVPLAVLELYLHAQQRPGALMRIAISVLLFVLTLGMAAGIFAVTAGAWAPNLKAAFDSRKSIAETLSATIASNGIDAAAKQYRDLKAAAPSTYNFDEDELNNLGYQLLRDKKFNDAIGIFQLNVEAYPQSSNVYDSLGEAYMDDGNKPQAIANYQKSLQLNPKNRNAVLMLQKLNAP
jgi:outer membrane protein assembly factor BamD (BamD/ComL family)